MKEEDEREDILTLRIRYLTTILVRTKIPPRDFLPYASDQWEESYGSNEKESSKAVCVCVCVAPSFSSTELD
jgi:hypothetical protein